MRRGAAILPAIVAAVSCAKASHGPAATADAPGAPADVAIDSCGSDCDTDMDGVRDGSDMCPDTPPGQPVNMVGCADSQLTAKLDPTWPPYGMTWTPSGDLGRAGGLTWTYTGIQRGDLFHIYWIVCDDPADACGLSLDGPIDVPSEKWTYSATDSDLPNGKLVMTNATNVLLADNSKVPVFGRLTITIVDSNAAPIPFADVGTLGVTARDGKYGAEIKGTGFKVVALAEVQDSTNQTWTPYLDYYDAAQTPESGASTSVSFGGYFYDE